MNVYRNLQAGIHETIHLRGQYFYYQSGSGSLKIKTAQNEYTIQPRQGIRFLEYFNDVTVYSDTNQNIEVITGGDEVIDNRSGTEVSSRAMTSNTLTASGVNDT